MMPENLSVWLPMRSPKRFPKSFETNCLRQRTLLDC